MGRRWALVVALMMCVGLNTSPAVQAHEQKTLAVILLDDGIPSGNITDPTFVQGNAVWFRMEDSTNNTSMVVQLDLDQDGVFNASNDFESGALVNACELDENGTLVDESCAVSATYAFPANASTGTYTFWIHRTHNESEERWEYHIVVHEDVHVEEGDGPSPGDCFGLGCADEETAAGDAVNKETADETEVVLLVAIIALVGMVATVLSIQKERREEKTFPSLNEEE